MANTRTTNGSTSANTTLDANLVELVTRLVREANAELMERIEGLSLQQTAAVRAQEGVIGNNNRAPQTSYTRLSKVEFPKFNGEDVRGWLYRCKQFFLIDNVAEQDKLSIVGVHLYDRALVWHQKYMNVMGANVTWDQYETAVLERFAPMFEDPMAEIKNLRQDGSVQVYQDAFDVLYNKLDIPEPHAISLFLAGLQDDIQMAVRMFKPVTLSNA